MNELSKEKMLNLEKKLVPVIKLLQKKYKDYGIDKSVIHNLLQQELNDNYEIYQKESEIKKIVSQIDTELSLRINEYIIDLFELDQQMIQNYINRNIHKKTDINTNIMELKKVTKYFSDIEYQPSLDFLISIIENNKVLNDILNYLISHTKKEYDRDKNIESVNIETLTNDDSIINLLECYCIVNDINVSEKKIDFDAIEKEFLDEEISAPINTTMLYLNSLTKPILSREEEREFLYKINHSEGAEQLEYKKDFIEHNLRLVISVANRYHVPNEQFLDIVQQGNIGLILALEHFDIEPGYKFATYAIWWIRQSINRYVEKCGRSLRIPSYFLENIKKYVKTKSIMEQKLNRDVTDEEIAKQLNWSEKSIRELKLYEKDAGSLNVLIGEEKDGDSIELIDRICDENIAVEEAAINNTVHDQLMAFLDLCNLKEREKEVLLYHNGFYDNRVFTFEELSKMYHVTHQRIDAIEKRALEKLRESPEVFTFIDYMNDPDLAKKSIFSFRKSYQEKTLKKRNRGSK